MQFYHQTLTEQVLALSFFSEVNLSQPFSGKFNEYYRLMLCIRYRQHREIVIVSANVLVTMFHGWYATLSRSVEDNRVTRPLSNDVQAMVLARPYVIVQYSCVLCSEVLLQVP